MSDDARDAANCPFYPACYIAGDCPHEGWKTGNCGLPKTPPTTTPPEPRQPSVREALERMMLFAEHDGDCGTNADPDGSGNCTCGYTAAMAEARQALAALSPEPSPASDEAEARECLTVLNEFADEDPAHIIVGPDGWKRSVPKFVLKAMLAFANRTSANNAPVARPPAASVGVSREVLRLAYAKIIDPRAWARREHFQKIIDGKVTMPEGPENAARYLRSAINRVDIVVADSLALADRLLALHPVPEGWREGDRPHYGVMVSTGERVPSDADALAAHLAQTGKDS